MTSPASPTTPSRPRFDAIDAARGVALAAMATYHALWDLGALRLTPENYALTPLGRAAAHGIAGSFLILVGLGLVLMNGVRFAARPFALRLARIAGAALLVTGATALSDPTHYIFFGILHCIAVASVLALPFVRGLPVWSAALAGLAIMAAPHLVSADWLDAPVLAFLGLGRGTPQTNDYVPLFPWAGLVLIGVALARAGLPAFAGSRAGGWRARGRLARGLTFAGRHSLAVYLIHQPVLMGLLTGLVTLTGPHPQAGVAEFRALYVRNCTATGGEAGACATAASCVSDAFRRDGLWADRPRSFTAEERLKAQALSQACYEAAEGTAPTP
ncbi:DUF1624 domain-containing protein [Methylobacterium sp. J-078]|uniref:DUF1624 domain-containing protein n=1 Tax=Methylobacterium sp. J-078 TaxID=2836657 RepID=UPI001FBBCD79|nr:heparan-alpha-glucosaminide N-acetyltransferase [Methylobacterium sp. J-078]MCJ2047082.1 DUF1624 domain-containing protein [Methylobacterium sp. J-078]